VRALALVTLLVLVGAGEAGARRARVARGANTFTGSCQLSGTIAFIPPLTSTPQNVTQQVQASGTCWGQFVGRKGHAHLLNNAPVTYQATEYAPGATCDGGSDNGSGTITFPYGSIKFTISETRIVAVALVTMKGDKGGSAAGQANVSPTANPQQVLTACGSATGLTQAPFDARAATTPSISG
jgi:hypothetical protein